MAGSRGNGPLGAAMHDNIRLPTGSPEDRDVPRVSPGTVTCSLNIAASTGRNAFRQRIARLAPRPARPPPDAGGGSGRRRIWVRTVVMGPRWVCFERSRRGRRQLPPSVKFENGALSSRRLVTPRVVDGVSPAEECSVRCRREVGAGRTPAVHAVSSRELEVEWIRNVEPDVEGEHEQD